MRTPALQTRTALNDAIATAPSLRAWARAHGIAAGTVSNVRLGYPCKLDKENAIRAALGLPPLTVQLVELDSTQRVVRKPGHGKRRPPRVDVYLTPEQMARLKERAKATGVSVPEYMRRAALELPQEGVSSLLDGR